MVYANSRLGCAIYLDRNQRIFSGSSELLGKLGRVLSERYRGKRGTRVKQAITTRMGVILLAAAGTVMVPALAEPALASDCSHPHSNLDTTSGTFIGNGVNIRRGPHSPPGLSCTSDGQGQRGDGADFHCFTVGDNVDGISTWSWVRNTRTGVQGWVNDGLLSGLGSIRACAPN